MTIQAAPDRLVIVVQTRMELDAALDRAPDLLKPAAITEGSRYLGNAARPRPLRGRLNAELPPGTTTEVWGSSFNGPRSKP